VGYNTVQVARSLGALGARPALELFQEPSYRRLWAAALCVNVVRWMDLVTLGWLALEFTGSPFMVSLAAFARSAPIMVVGPLGGIVADRVPRGTILVATQAAGVATALALGVIFASGAGGYAILVSIETLVGVLWAVDFPARRTALYSILGPQRVARAVSLDTVLMQVAKMLGPLVAGLCLARLGPVACYALMAALSAAALAASAGLRGGLGGPGDPSATSVLASLRAGLEVAWAHPTVRAVLLVTIAMNTLFFPYQQMLSVFARDVLSGGPAVLGALVAADGGGALLGALAIASWHGHVAHRTLFAASVLVSPLLLAALSSFAHPAACLALLVVMGVAESGFAAMQSTIVLLSAPERTRGGVVGILSACIGTQPIGTLAIGLLATGLGVSGAFGLNALVALVVIVPLAAPLLRPLSR